MVKLKVEYLPHYDKNWGELAFKHPDDSGLDVRAAIHEPITLKSLDRALIPNGIRLQIDDGDDTDYELQIRPRSGLASKYGLSLPNCVATIDYGYRGELITAVINLSRDDYTIHPGDRIAQLILCPIKRPEIITVEKISDKSLRGDGGFGSTGKK